MGCERGLMLVYIFLELWNMNFLLDIAVVLFHDSFSGVSWSNLFAMDGIWMDYFGIYYI